ncbi:MAG TPA: hypothetical protein VHF02_09970 [Luteimonas sp.]|nr:hypothetical protein [Luteimonas sp.]
MTQQHIPDTRPQLRRNRAMLVAIFAIFFGSMLVAGALRFSGWRPAGMKNHGELLEPAADLRALVPKLADGSDYRWNPGARLWRIALAPPADCVEVCINLAHDLDTVWQLTGKDADRVHVLWIGTPPAAMPRDAALRVLQASPALRAGLPRVDEVTFNGRRGVPVYVIDPNGFVILRYAPGFDPAGLRADLAKLLKLM